VVGLQIDPVTGGGDACTVIDAERQPGTAIAERVVGRRAVTVIGAPKVRANLEIDGVRPDVSQIAGRLWDVAPDGGTQLLVARGTFRPSGDGEARWYLHPAAHRFAPGHTIRLELLGNDLPYARPSNGVFSIDLDGLEAKLPVRARR
jgi:predicted acyl esterase